jgi:hypothetical protein
MVRCTLVAGKSGSCLYSSYIIHFISTGIACCFLPTSPFPPSPICEWGGGDSETEGSCLPAKLVGGGKKGEIK